MNTKQIAIVYVRLISTVAVFAVAMVKLSGVPFNFLCLGTPLAVAVALFAFAPFAGRAKGGVLAFASLLAFATIYPVALYAGATTARPFVDGILARLDCGIAPAIYHFAKSMPLVDGILTGIYNTVFIQTFMVIAFLTITFKGQRLAAFSIRFMLSCLITLILFCLFPAQGTVAGGLPVPEGYETILSELSRLRAAPTFLMEGMPAGLVTFPSFHTTWAVLLTAAFHKTPIFKLAVVINGLMIVSTMTIGMHYFCDVLGGLFVSAVVIAAIRVSESPATVVQSERAWLLVWQRALSLAAAAAAAARSLGQIMRQWFAVGTPRGLHPAGDLAALVYLRISFVWSIAWASAGAFNWPESFRLGRRPNLRQPASPLGERTCRANHPSPKGVTSAVPGWAVGPQNDWLVCHVAVGSPTSHVCCCRLEAGGRSPLAAAKSTRSRQPAPRPCLPASRLWPFVSLTSSPPSSGTYRCTMVMAAGPTSTTKMAGKMKITSGKISFTAVLAAFSSANCRRRVRIASLCTRRAWAMLEPNLSA